MLERILYFACLIVWLLSSIALALINGGGTLIMVMTAFSFLGVAVALILFYIGGRQSKEEVKAPEIFEDLFYLLSCTMLITALVEYALIIASYKPTLADTWVASVPAIVLGIASAFKFALIVVVGVPIFILTCSNPAVGQDRFYWAFNCVGLLVVLFLPAIYLPIYQASILSLIPLCLGIGFLFAFLRFKALEYRKSTLITGLLAFMCCVAGVVSVSVSMWPSGRAGFIFPSDGYFNPMLNTNYNLESVFVKQNAMEYDIYAVCAENSVSSFYGCSGSKVLSGRNVDVSKYVNSSMSKYSQWLWGHDLKNAPIQGRVFVPKGNGPFPVFIIAHGNNPSQIGSYQGYDYLLSGLAKQGIIAMSVGHEFLSTNIVDILESATADTGIPKEDEVLLRSIMILETMKNFLSWNSTNGNDLAGKISNNFAVAGHSTGAGRAALITPAVSNWTSIPEKPNSGPLNYRFNINAVIALGSEGIYNEGDDFLNNIRFPSDLKTDLYILHGTHDGQHLPTATKSYFPFENVKNYKSHVAVFGLTNVNFNAVWSSGYDGALKYFVPFINDRTDIFSFTTQSEMTLGLVSSALRVSLLGKPEYLNVLKQPKTYLDIWATLPKMTYFNCFYSPVTERSLLDSSNIVSGDATVAFVKDYRISSIFPNGTTLDPMSAPSKPLAVFRKNPDATSLNVQITAPISPAITITNTTYFSITYVPIYEPSPLVLTASGEIRLNTIGLLGGSQVRVGGSNLMYTSFPIQILKNNVEQRNFAVTAFITGDQVGTTGSTVDQVTFSFRTEAASAIAFERIVVSN